MATRKQAGTPPVSADEIAAASDPDALLSARVTAALVDVHWRTLHRWEARGLFPPAVYVMGLKRYRAGAVREWLQAASKSGSASGMGCSSTGATPSRESR
jgi:hypothetical protein